MQPQAALNKLTTSALHSIFAHYRLDSAFHDSESMLPKGCSLSRVSICKRMNLSGVSEHFEDDHYDQTIVIGDGRTTSNHREPVGC